MSAEAQPAAAAEVSALHAEIRRLHKVIEALMNRVEMNMSARTSDFGLFQTTITLENQVRARTAELEAAVRENERVNRALLQAEKMVAVGQLAAGVAHEINNPLGFINSNLGTLRRQVDDLLALIDVYRKAEPLLAGAPERLAEIRAAAAKADLEFVRDDIAELIGESLAGVTRVRRIVQDLKDFTRVDLAEWHFANIETGLDSTLGVVASTIREKAEVVREYAGLPEVECIAAQLNQVFMCLLVNAAQAIEQRGRITLRTGCDASVVWVEVEDSGKGIAPENLGRIFEPFFTTRPVGKGTGLGLSLAYGIVRRHHGKMSVRSTPGCGTTFRVAIPRRRANAERGET